MENDDAGLRLAQARDKFVAETLRDLEANLRQYNLWKEPDPLTLYIVSNLTLYDHTKDTEECDIERETAAPIPAEKRKGGKLRAHYIHEPELVNDLLRVAHERRYSGGAGYSFASTASSSLSKLVKAVSLNT